jgi:beta-1,2-mannobiose phosphorylase / 1,2-beta-oligomannan phosphorylase
MQSEERRNEYYRMSFEAKKNNEKEYDTPEVLAKCNWGTRLGWVKYEKNPVLGGRELGTCFDVSVLKEKGIFKMWFSWRVKQGIGYTESTDGLHWGAPRLVFKPLPWSPWEGDEVNRPVVVFAQGKYRMWYTGQMIPALKEGSSRFGYAESDDGVNWSRKLPEPVLYPTEPWEEKTLMCPHVNFNAEKNLYEMWYSGGSNAEADAIGYASSEDGIRWVKHNSNPVFVHDPKNLWEQDKVLACQVIKDKDYYYMLYLGHIHLQRGSIGMARSKDGKTNWERHPLNPIIAPDKGTWDAKSVFKPFALWDEDHWILWYNGGAWNYDYFDCTLEQIGVAFLNRKELWPK